MTTHSSERPPPAARDEDADLFDYALIRDNLLFVVRSVPRHPWLATLLFLCAVGGALGVLSAIPKTYRVESTILAQRNQVIAALGNPNRTMPYEADAPTRAATETVLRQDNLVALIKQTDLLDRWVATRAPAQAVKDWVVRLVLGPLSDEDALDALVGLLEKELRVSVGDGTVTIALQWQDAETAYRLVEQAQQNFLEARHVQEISTIAEAISILEGHAGAVHDEVESSLEEIKGRTPVRAGKGHRPADGLLAPRAARPPPVDPQLAQMKVMLDAKRRAIEDLEEFRRCRLAELTAQLSEARTT